jgi:crossover junction endodeoxyribonuclease RusA
MTLLELRVLTFTLPMPLSVNEAWYHVPYLDEDTPSDWVLSKRLKVRTVLTNEHRQYRSTVISLVRASMRKSEQRDQPLLGRLHLSGQFLFSDRRRTDVDNRIKPLQDALTHAGAYRDDSQIDVLGEFHRIIHAGAERCDVVLREIAV